MKKILAIVAGILTLASCSLPEDIFVIRNLNDFLSCKGGILYNDVGTPFTVTQDLTDKNWNAEGNRIYAAFDITNSHFDITLSGYLKAGIYSTKTVPVPEKENPDPVILTDCSVGGGYLNIVLSYYYKPGTECPHQTSLYATDKDDTLTLTLVHDGNAESPAYDQASTLQTASAACCFTLAGLVPEGEYRKVVLEFDLLTKDEEGIDISKHTSSRLFEQPVQF